MHTNSADYSVLLLPAHPRSELFFFYQTTTMTTFFFQYDTTIQQFKVHGACWFTHAHSIHSTPHRFLVCSQAAMIALPRVPQTGVHPLGWCGVRVDPPRRHPLHPRAHDERSRVEGEGPRQLRTDRG